MATIKAIEGRSVHQIQSGQVIVDLCSVVKELVENSLDAGTTSIDVRFKNNGLDAIEVQDNGSGISPEDFESLALKHYTSKLSTYDDLETLDTFGFRGEALSSLSALSKLSIITARAEDAPKGSKLEFEISGRLGNRSTVASTKGTTVAVSDIFYNYPVRRKELEKNIKREYGKALGILHAYACISTGVRVSVSNADRKGKKTVVFSTKSNLTTRENIANIYGAKTLLALVPLELKLEMRSTSSIAAKFAQNGPADREVSIEGHISRPVFGEGRQLPDRQMFFVNSRPCGLPQISKAINEVYKSFNLSQSPFILANFKMDTGSYDVNVSPDKRTIMLHDQGELLESLKAALVEMFAAQDQTMPQSQLLHETQTPMRQYMTGVNTGLGARRPIHEQSSADHRSTVSDIQDAAPSSEFMGSSSPTGTPSNLIQKFASRSAGLRRNSIDGQPPGTDAISNAKRRLAGAFAAHSPGHEEGASEEVHAESGNEEREPRGARSPLFVSDEPGEPSPSPDTQPEERIPYITTAARLVQAGPVQNAFDRIRLKRRSPDFATVTIGNRTTEVPIGSIPRKRAKLAYGSSGCSNSSAPSARGSKYGLAHFAAGRRSFGEGSSLPEPESEEDDDEKSREGQSQASRGEEVPELPRQHRNRSAPSGADDDSDGSRQDISDGESAAEEETHISPKRTDVREDSLDEASETDAPEEESDDAYIDEAESTRRHKEEQEARVAQLIAEAEEQAARPTEDNIKRRAKSLTARPGKTSTYHLQTTVPVDLSLIQRQLSASSEQSVPQGHESSEPSPPLDVDDRKAEEKLSLTVSKTDFARMKIIGQFNKGFILATRPSDPSRGKDDDELFIIDQHASDEKYNFERLQAETIVQNQRLVQPRRLDLTAIEEETILNNPSAFRKNGFNLEVDTSGAHPVGQRCSLLTLPMSRDTSFDIRDLEELIVLVGEQVVGSDVPRPSKVRKMFAMRACRGSIMVGDELTMKKMKTVVRHMGEIDKPWNCPHGRPTMRHLFTLRNWRGWKEGDGSADGRSGLFETDWSRFLGRYGLSRDIDNDGEDGSSGAEESAEPLSQGTTL